MFVYLATPLGCASFRNVFICNGATDTFLDKLRQNRCSCGFSVIFWPSQAPSSTWRKEFPSESVVAIDNPLQPGESGIHPNLCLIMDNNLGCTLTKIADHKWAFIRRIFSHSTSGRGNSFKKGIRDRDQECVVTGLPNRITPLDFRSGFESLSCLEPVN